MEDEIPRFIKLGGCINCSSSKKYKERYDKDYGFDHELMAGCLIYGCQEKGFSLVNPYMDPMEMIDSLKIRELKPEEIRNFKIYSQKVNERFGKYYKKMGISFEEIINSL